MKKNSNKGFVLAETLVTTVFLMVIFTMIYTNFYPLIGEYEKRENYDTADGKYAAFGSVIEGMDEVDKIVKSRVITRSPFGGGKDRPVEPPVMKKVTVETFGVEYPEPQKM